MNGMNRVIADLLVGRVVELIVLFGVGLTACYKNHAHCVKKLKLNNTMMGLFSTYIY